MINRVHKGVPDSVRGKFWYILLDLDNIKKQQVTANENILINILVYYYFNIFAEEQGII